jgi:hypothetical protein
MTDKTNKDAAAAYNALITRATEIAGVETGQDLAGAAITKVLQESPIYPDKSLSEIAQQVLSVELTTHYFSLRKENEVLRKMCATENEPEQFQEPINYHDILTENIPRMNDLEKLVAYGVLKGKSPKKIAAERNVSVEYIEHIILMVYSYLDTGGQR